VTATTAKPNDVLVKRPDQTEFLSAGLYIETGWWKSIAGAPSQPSRLYLTGYDVSGKEPTVHLRRSDDEGVNWVELPTGDFEFGDEPLLYIEAVSPTDPDLVFARVAKTGSPVGDSIYRSTDAGVTWTKVVDTRDFVTGVVVRADGRVIIATVNDGVRVSTDLGAPDSFIALDQPPRLACLEDSPGGTLYGCAANWEPDNFALGTSPDGSSWTKVTQFQDLVGPLSCPEGTPQLDVCVLQRWPGVCAQLGVCGGAASDAGPDGGQTERPEPTDGCGCRSSAPSSVGALLLGALLLLLLRRRAGHQ
jgi:MYXO-CTERM domain-containing protein